MRKTGGCDSLSRHPLLSQPAHLNPSLPAKRCLPLLPSMISRVWHYKRVLTQPFVVQVMALYFIDLLRQTKHGIPYAEALASGARPVELTMCNRADLEYFMCLPCGASRLCARVLSDSLSLAPPLAGARARALALDLSLSRACSLSCARCRSLAGRMGTARACHSGSPHSHRRLRGTHTRH